MSAIVVFTPIITAAWPAFSSAVAAAAAGLGFTMHAAKAKEEMTAHEEKKETVALDIQNSSVVTDALAKEDEATFTKDDISLTFRKDARGKCSICVSGEGRSRDELRSIGNEAARKVVQEYVHAKVVGELQKRGFEIANEEVSEDKAIRLTVRRWR